MAIAHFPQAKKPGFCGELCRGECASRPYCGSKKETRFLEFLKGAIAFLWGAIPSGTLRDRFFGGRYPSYNVLRVIIDNSYEP